MSENKSLSTWVEIALDAIQGNVHLVRQQTGKQIMAIVKANGYGHGALAVARAALDAGATWCGVARLEEALDLRRAGLECPILLLSWTPPELIHVAISNRISMAVWTYEQADWMAAEAKRLKAEQEVAAQRRAAQKAKQTEIDKYMNLIENRIYQNWIMPPSTNKGLVCVLQVQLIPTGEVINIDGGFHIPRL